MKRSLTLTTLFAVFMTTLLAVSVRGLPEPWVILLLGLASSFGGRATAYMTIFEWLRKPFTVVVPHSSGAGESVEPRKDRGPIIQAVGEGLSCPVCAGTWVAAALLVLWTLVPAYGMLLLYVLSAGAIGSTLTRLIEYLEWAARHQWELTGYASWTNKQNARFSQKLMEEIQPENEYEGEISNVEWEKLLKRIEGG